MTDDKKPVPVRALTIRLGDEVFTEVHDYVLLVRDSEGGMATRISNHHWARGAVVSLQTIMDDVDMAVAEHDCDGNCGGEKPE